ncbi:MAG: hypothetical protein P8J87_17665, partial [Verrucomicrobiales bacterium]|nr:hypothetical protein [Verrucomicrobiales bacterium]
SVANASDHRPVYLDLTILPFIDEAVRSLKVTRSGDRLAFAWTIDPGTSYAITHSTDLESWSASPSVAIEIENQQATATDTVSEIRKYYRIETWYE